MSLTMIAVVLGLIIGFILRFLRSNSISLYHPSETAVKLIKFPGDILLRMLKSLVLPLIAASIIVGIASLSNSETSKRKLVVRTILYFLITTAIAVILGIVLYASIRPGRSLQNGFSLSCFLPFCFLTCLGLVLGLLPSPLAFAAFPLLLICTVWLCFLLI